MTSAQEAKLDRLLELTATHSVKLAALTSQTDKLAERTQQLSGSVTQLQTVHEERGKRVDWRISLAAIGIAAMSLVANIAQALIR